MGKDQNNKKPMDLSLPLFDADTTKAAEKMLFGAAHMQGMTFRAMLRYNLEAARFLQHRLEEDLKTANTLAKCHSFSELNEAGIEFCQRAMEEYSEEATKLSNLGVNLATKTVRDLQEEAANAGIEQSK